MTGSGRKLASKGQTLNICFDRHMKIYAETAANSGWKRVAFDFGKGQKSVDP